MGELAEIQEAESLGNVIRNLLEKVRRNRSVLQVNIVHTGTLGRDLGNLFFTQPLDGNETFDHTFTVT